MSEPARQHPAPDSAPRSPGAPGPLRDWLAAMRAAAAEQRDAPQAAPSLAKPQPPAREIGMAESGFGGEPVQSRAPRRVIPPAAKAEPEPDDEISELMAENMLLKARLRLEAERQDELQRILAQEIRELRQHVQDEIAKLDGLRAERDLWMARCEALATPLFQPGPKR